MVHHVIAPAAQLTHGVVTTAITRWYISLPLLAAGAYLWWSAKTEQEARNAAVANAARRASSDPRTRRELERRLADELL